MKFAGIAVLVLLTWAVDAQAALIYRNYVRERATECDVNWGAARRPALTRAAEYFILSVYANHRVCGLNGGNSYRMSDPGPGTECHTQTYHGWFDRGRQSQCFTCYKFGYHECHNAGTGGLPLPASQ